jgi:hypothetical protein
MSTKCSVVRGSMTLYTYDSYTFENLEVRTIDAIKEDMEDDTFVKEHFLSANVLGVKFVGSNITDAISKAQDSISSSPGYVSSIIGSPASASTGSGTLDMFTFPVMILIALGAILLVLIALFVGTSKTTNRKRRYYDSHYGDENSYGIKQIKSSDVLGQSIAEKDRTATTPSPSQYCQEMESEYYFGNFLPTFDDIGSTLSRTFSGFSDRAQTRGDVGDDSVSPLYETYETTINNGGGVRIRGVCSNIDEDYEDCYSISSVYDDDDIPPPPPSSPGRLRSFPSPGRRLFASRRNDQSEIDTNEPFRDNPRFSAISERNDKAPPHRRIIFASMSNDEIEIETDGLSSRDSLRPLATPGRSNKPPRRNYPSPSHVIASKMKKRSKNRGGRDVSLGDDAFLDDDEVTGIEVSLRPVV